MSREIKFRAWRVDIETDQPRMFDFDELRSQYEGEMGDMFSDDSVIELMQYTGLLDKNGVEIYEGDIIKYQGKPDPMHIGEVIGEVRWSGIGRAGFDPFVSGFNQRTEQLEVIGNIYEDSHLLENAEILTIKDEV